MEGMGGMARGRGEGKAEPVGEGKARAGEGGKAGAKGEGDGVQSARLLQGRTMLHA